MANTLYAIKIAGQLYPKGTSVRLATLEEMQAAWPGMTIKPNSKQVGVWFGGMSHPTIVHRNQLDLSAQHLTV